VESLIGKTLKNEKDEEYIVLSELNFKNIPCVYAMKVMPDESEGEKTFFQVTGDSEIKLVNITSKKMLNALIEKMFAQNKQEDKPRKIKEDESIANYLAYLDEYYKTKVVTII